MMGHPFATSFFVFKEVDKMTRDYEAHKLDYLYEIKYDTDKAIKLGQAMYETSIEVSKVDYINLLVIFGIFSQICRNRYDIDISFSDFWRMQKIVHEQSDLYKKRGVKKSDVGII